MKAVVRKLLQLFFLYIFRLLCSKQIILRLIYWLAAILTAVLLSISWPANGISILSLFALVPLLFVVRTFSLKKEKGIVVFGYLYLSFFIWNLLTTYWVYYSTAGGAVMMLTLNSLFMALVWLIFYHAQKRFGNPIGYFVLIITWLSFELFHLEWDLSWPWLMLGNVFANSIKLIQWYSFTGVLGGTLWVLLSNIICFEILNKQQTHHFSKMVAIGLAVIFVPIVISLLQFTTYQEKLNPIEVVVVQPNIDPWFDKFKNLTPEQQMNRILNLASSAVTPSTQYVVAPETAIPRGVWKHTFEYNEEIKTIRAFINEHPQVKFITGLTYLEIFTKDQKIPFTAEQFSDDLWYDDYNAAVQLDGKGNHQLYFKSKLVPGPERFPFARLLKPFQHTLFKGLSGGVGDMGTQPERSVFFNEDLNINAAPVICYESIYGEFVTEYIQKGANFIAVSTNDAWWGESPGYKQLLAYTRLRAIETRRSIARSANTGISCAINQKGEVLQGTKYNTQDAVALTINTNDEITFYTRYGDFLGRIAYVLLAGYFIFYVLVRFKIIKS